MGESKGQEAAGLKQPGTTITPVKPAISPTSQEGRNPIRKSLEDQLARNATITDPQAASSSTSQEGLGTDSTVYAISTQTGEEESHTSSTYSRQTKKRSFRFTRWQ